MYVATSSGWAIKDISVSVSINKKHKFYSNFQLVWICVSFRLCVCVNANIRGEPKKNFLYVKVLKTGTQDYNISIHRDL